MRLEDKRKSKTTEMRMLQKMCRKTLKDKTDNEKISEIASMGRLKEFLREHVERMDEERGPVKALGKLMG